MKDLTKIISEVWNTSKKVILNVVGGTSLVIGTIGLFLPGIPGALFLLFGSFCLKLAKEVDQEKGLEAI